MMRKLVTLLVLASALPAFCSATPAVPAHKSSDNYLQIVSCQYAPISTINWTAHNLQRADLVILKQVGRFKETLAETSIPPNERQVTAWNANPFELDSGDGGRSEDDGAFFLLPYWLGRYDHFLSCPQ